MVHCPTERCLTDEERSLVELECWEVWGRPGGGVFMTAETLIDMARADRVIEEAKRCR